MTRRALLALLAALLLPLSPVAAQRRGRVEVQLPPRERAGAEGPLVRATGIVSDASLRDLVRNGFPARLHYRAELWSDDGWFNDLKRTHEWDVILRYDPLDETYRVYQADGTRVGLLGRSASYEEMRELAERPTLAPIPPRRGGKYYYVVALEVETLSLGDLDELERWLRGELRPAVRTPAKAGTALTRGVRTLVVRLLGGERRQYEGRSGTFTVR